MDISPAIAPSDLADPATWGGSASRRRRSAPKVAGGPGWPRPSRGRRGWGLPQAPPERGERDYRHPPSPPSSPSNARASRTGRRAIGPVDAIAADAPSRSRPGTATRNAARRSSRPLPRSIEHCASPWNGGSWTGRRAEHDPGRPMPKSLLGRLIAVLALLLAAAVTSGFVMLSLFDQSTVSGADRAGQRGRRPGVRGGQPGLPLRHGQLEPGAAGCR